ncbi:hypothetical protein GCM10008967_07620 [Bacillus carboniphilus]|uniref:Group-specific protein n=1 Tax=Bacillus carboniphilus TaxID=86663 RepID=A0ABN0VX92_9BACI
MASGWIVSSIVVAILSIVFAGVIISLQRKVVNKPNGKVDFQKTEIYFRWTRWDTINTIAAVYSFACFLVLVILVSSGENVENPYVQFFMHQAFVFTTITFGWLISRTAITIKGIKERWSHELEHK